jgi:hypothetical protein
LTAYHLVGRSGNHPAAAQHDQKVVDLPGVRAGKLPRAVQRLPYLRQGSAAAELIRLFGKRNLQANCGFDLGPGGSIRNLVTQACRPDAQRVRRPIQPHAQQFADLSLPGEMISGNCPPFGQNQARQRQRRADQFRQPRLSQTPETRQ